MWPSVIYWRMCLCILTKVRSRLQISEINPVIIVVQSFINQFIKFSKTFISCLYSDMFMVYAFQAWIQNLDKSWDHVDVGRNSRNHLHQCFQSVKLWIVVRGTTHAGITRAVTVACQIGFDLNKLIIFLSRSSRPTDKENTGFVVSVTLFLFSRSSTPTANTLNAIWRVAAGRSFVSCRTKSQHSVASVCIRLALIGISLWSVLFQLRSPGFKPCRLAVCLLWSRLWHLRRNGRRMRIRDGWRRRCQALINIHPDPSKQSHLFGIHWIGMTLNMISIKAQSTVDKIVTSGHRRSKCLGGKCWSKISLQLFTQFCSRGREIHLKFSLSAIMQTVFII